MLFAAGTAAAQTESTDTLAYRLGPKDLIEVQVVEEPRLDLERRVNDRGGLILPLLGELQVAGLTPAEAETLIKTRLEESFLQRATVAVRVVEFRSRPISVIGAVRREAPPGRFRSNLHQGGRGTAIELDDALADVALRAASTLGLDAAGIDVLESKRGPLVIEVNASPGLHGFEAATGLDVAECFLQHVEERCRNR